jgi:hypothetical protein
MKSPARNFTQIRPVKAKLFHADGRADRQTDMDLTIAFRNTVKAHRELHHSSVPSGSDNGIEVHLALGLCPKLLLRKYKKIKIK